MHTFEIAIEESTGEGSRVVVDYAAGGFVVASRLEATFQLLPPDREALSHAIRARDYGEILGRALFKDKVAERFQEAITAAKAAATPEPLRVMLSVNDPRLQHLRWERLCAELDGGWRHLALNQGSPLTLSISSETTRQYPAIGRQDLSALIFVAMPTGVEPFDVEQTVAGIRAALGDDTPHKVIATGMDGPRPTLDALVAHLTAHTPPILHIVCHGQMSNNRFALFFEEEDGSKAIVTDKDLVGALAPLRRPPYFTFMSACESAAIAEGAAHSGLGQLLAREYGMLAVVAMTDKVTVTTATDLSKTFYAQLLKHGELDLALVEATAGRHERIDILVPVLFSRLDGRPLFDTADQPLQQLSGRTIGDGLENLKGELQYRGPVLIDAVEDQETILRPLLGTDATSLAPTAQKDRADALNAVNAICLEALEISFAALALGNSPPEYDRRSPFRANRPFGDEDHEFFTGRADLIEPMVASLNAGNVLTVIGPSGSGKTSMVLAGLIPTLRRREQERGSDLTWIPFAPGRTPQIDLDRALATLADPKGLLVIDRFESLFLGEAPAAERAAFLARLVGEMQTRRVVLTMRSDCLEICRDYPALWTAMGGRTVVVPPLNVDSLRMAIGNQAAAKRLTFEAGLIETILDDTGREPGRMALIQFVLEKLWEHRHGRVLRTCEYDALGRVRCLVVDRADEVFDRLSQEERVRAQEIFMRLTLIQEESSPDEASRDDRRRVPLPDLVPDEGDPLATRALVHRLADAGLVVVS